MSETDGTHFRELEADGYPAEEYGIDPRQAKVEDAQAELLVVLISYPNERVFRRWKSHMRIRKRNKRLFVKDSADAGNNLNISKTSAEESSVFSLQRVKVIYQIFLVAGQITHTMQVDLLNFSIPQNGNNTCQREMERIQKALLNDTTLNPGVIVKHLMKHFDKAMASLGEERDAVWGRSE